MDIFSDFRYALRRLKQSPGFTSTAIALLTLGIGANAAIFSVVYAVILRPLPYPEPSKLVFVWQHFHGLPAPFSEHMAVARQNYREWQRQNTVFQEMAAYHTRPVDGSGDDVGPVFATFASTSLFHLLGVEPEMGRLFRSEEEREGHNHVAILSDAYFDRRFHRDPKALAKPIVLDDTAYTVIGVLSSSFYLPRTIVTDRQPDVIVPLPDVSRESKDHMQLTVAARLRPGVSLAQARTEMASIAERIEKQQKPDAALYTLGSASVFPFSVENADPRLNRALCVLLAAVALVLLIACANLANLMLARGTMRLKESMIRLALGATRGRVLAGFLYESLLLATVGAACGLALAEWSISLIRTFKPPDIKDLNLIAINLPVLAFTAGVAGLTVLLFGLGPALVVSRADIAARLKATGGWGASATRTRGRQFLIAIEVALALMLLTGAGLMIRSLQQIALVGVGFDTSRLTALDINLPLKRYPQAGVRARLVRDLIASTRAIPGVEDAAVISDLPLHSVSMNVFHIEGRPERSRDSAPVADVALVSPGFFHLMELRLVRGRWLMDADLSPDGNGKDVAMVNRAFARKYFPGESPLGKRLLSGDTKESFEIVGVVADFRSTGAENDPRPEIFRPSLRFSSATLVVRSRGAQESFGRSLLETARSVSPDLAAQKVKTMEAYAGDFTSQRRFNTLLLEIFAGLALALAVLGMYSVFSNLVTSRTREIGIRMAIGATPSAIRRLVIWQGTIPLLIGMVTGVGGCMAFSRLVQSMLYQVQARDPLVMTAAVTAVVVTFPAALWLPLRRAAAVECTVALREE